MADTGEKTPRQLSIENGEQLVITIAVCFVLFEVLATVINIENRQGINLIRAVLTLVSCFFLYKGKRWAKYLLTIGSLFGAMFGLFLCLLSLFTGEPALFNFRGFVFVGFTFFNCLAAYYLVFSGDVDEFMKSRKA